MNKLRLTVGTLAVFTVILACSAIGQAQTKRVYVKTSGSDTAAPGTCVFTNPCRTFQKAFNVAKAVGTQPEIDVLDSGDYSNAQSDDAAIRGGAALGNCAGANCTLTLDSSVTIDGNGFLGTLSGGEFFTSVQDAVRIAIPAGNFSAVINFRNLAINGGHQG